MTDINGVELKIGDVVCFRITKAKFILMMVLEKLLINQQFLWRENSINKNFRKVYSI
jgi:hypothetical protein